MLHCRLNLGSCRSPLRPIMAVGWNIRLEKYESGYQYLQGRGASGTGWMHM